MAFPNTNSPEKQLNIKQSTNHFLQITIVLHDKNEFPRSSLIASPPPPKNKTTPMAYGNMESELELGLFTLSHYYYFSTLIGWLVG